MELRLFPLRTVLFPGMKLPLQVFEPRYRQLVSECMESLEPFGVALIREGVEVGGPAVPYSMGTTASIDSLSPAPDGRLQLLTTGRRRFRILELHTDRPYLWANIDYPVEEAGEVPEELLRRAQEGLAAIQRLRAAAAGEYEREPRLPEEPGAVADAIAGLAPAHPIQLQALLETLDVRTRLEETLPLLESILVTVHHEAASSAAARWAAPGSTN